MATVAWQRPALAGEARFFLIVALVMAAFNVLAFSLFAFFGISTFHAPIYVHVHAVLFMGWVVLFVTQVSLAANGSLRFHRKLGWVAVGWALTMIVVGTATTIWTVQRDRVPFFFLPAQFLFMNPLSVTVFGALLIGGVVKRRDRDWHPRLIVCAMAAIMGPSFGRLLPAPLLMYWMFTAVFAAMIAFPVAGIIRDKRRYGRVHPAWLVGLSALLLMQLACETIGRSALAASVYDRVVAGTEGARQPALAYPPPPFPTKP